jgi:nitrite reductase/ring-hydroxylating ferredoxin subunit
MRQERSQGHLRAQELLSERRPGQQWRVAFPYRWDADDLVSRRSLLYLAVATSGALFASTGLLALLGLVQREERFAAHPIARITEVPEGGTLLFRYPGPDDDALLLHLPGGRLVAYSQRCTHLSCAVYYQPERERIYCPCHDGVFDPLTGQVVAGPPSRPLPRILLRTENGVVYAVGREP